MEIKTDGLVIRESYTGEADRLITVLTRDAGIIRAFVKGARGIKSAFTSASGLLAFSSFVFYVSQKGYYTVKSAVCKEVFYALREDITKLSLAQYFASLAYEFAPDESESEEMLRLLLNGLYFLSEGKRSQMLLKAVTELKTVSMAGYMPSVSACSRCAVSFSEKTLYFCPALGEAFCRDHCPAAKSYELLPGVITAMEYIFYTPVDKLFALKVSGASLEQLSEVAEDYLLRNTEKKFAALDFYHSVTR